MSSFFYQKLQLKETLVLSLIVLKVTFEKAMKESPQRV